MTHEVPTIFDARRRDARHQRASVRQRQPSAARWLLDTMGADIVERLGFLRFEGSNVLISGLGGSHLAIEGQRVPLSQWDRPLDRHDYDLIVSMNELDTINDLPGALIHMRSALRSGGLLLATMVGAGSLPRLRQAMLAADGDRPAARTHPQIDSFTASALLQRAGFARQVVDHHTLTVRYGAFATLLSDLRDQGLGSVLADRAPPITRSAYEAAERDFADQADDSGKTSERFEVLTMTAWKD